MAIVTMKRLRLLAMGEDRAALLDDLQRLGCVEVSEPTLDGREESGAAELLYLHTNTGAARVKKIKELLGISPLTSIRYAIFMTAIYNYLNMV